MLGFFDKTTKINKLLTNIIKGTFLIRNEEGDRKKYRQ